MKDSITIDGVKYVREDLTKKQAEKLDGMVYCMVRAEKAGVFAGYVASRNGKEVVLKNARRIWYWDGAASLSQLAMEGTRKPQNCKFPCEVEEVELFDVCEIIPITAKAQKSIFEVPIWKK
jgi:hypothetical protein